MSLSTFSILLVCTANICRSPAAQSMLAQQFSNHAVRVESAGTLALDGNPVDAVVSRLLHARGLDAMVSHRSRTLMPTMLARYDLVLCMQDEHVRQVLALHPMGRGKVRLLGHWSKQQILDPVGKSESVYADSLDQIHSCTAQWAQKMIDMGMIQ